MVDTIGIWDELEIDTGVRHSDQFHLIERIHLDPDDPDMLVNEMTHGGSGCVRGAVPSDGPLRPRPVGKLIEFQCSENNRNPVDEDGDTQFE